jgi:hypothetical protein
VRTRGSKSHGKTSPQNHQKLESFLGNIEIFLAQNPIFLVRNPIFLYGFLTFVNGFLLSSMAFCFPQWLFDFPQWLSTFREIQENLSTVASIRKIAILASYFPSLALRAL